MKYEKLSNSIVIPQNSYVDVKIMGNITEVKYNEHRNSKAKITKLNAKEYLVNSTGEVKEYKEASENRSVSKESMRHTMNRIKELIQTNVTNPSKVRFLTLTYKENMQDCARLYNDWRKFNQRLQLYLKKKYSTNAEYISVVEPQGRGAWHIHSLYIFSKNAPFIPNEKIAEIWGLGFTKITALDNVDNVGVYLTAYLSDIEISEENKDLFNENEIKEIKTDTSKKYYVKGARLSFYPSNFNIIRHSRGIKNPKTMRMTMKKAEELVKEKKLVYETTYSISNDEGYSTVINKKEYK